MEVKQHFFQGTCFFCLAKTNSAWCADCENDFMLREPSCPVCGRASHSNEICGNCLKQPPFFDTTETLFNYQFPTNHLIKAFKFNQRPELAKQLAKRFSEKILLQRFSVLPETIIPVPLHQQRQKERGYNQSLELARHLSKRLDTKINDSLCQRILNTQPQSTLPMKTRRKNVRGAFVLNKQEIPNHIAIVDDVITTGSTINEMASLFKKAGCEQIDVWAVARA